MHANNTRMNHGLADAIAQPISFRRCAGLTIIEVLVVLIIIALLSATLAPVVRRVGAGSMTTVSMNNLKTLSAAHAAYAADWNGRQMTLVVDDLATYPFGVYGYQQTTGEFHPPIQLGWGCSSTGLGAGSLWGFWFFPLPVNATLVWPINPAARFGWFRIPNAKALHDYVNGKFYDATFYAPGDVAAMAAVEPILDDPCEFLPTVVIGSSLPFWSSYCMSPAALFHPNVMARDNPALSGTVSDLPPDAFTAPSFAQVRYPDLKTHMIEHNWVENPPATCNPAFVGGTYLGCEPYYFNHGAVASPVTLFYDGHVRVFPNTEAIAADAAVSEDLGSVDGLWFSPGGALGISSPLATGGYYIRAGFDQLDIDHTILTVDGILGRDTIVGAGRR